MPPTGPPHVCGELHGFTATPRSDLGPESHSVDFRPEIPVSECLNVSGTGFSLQEDQ